VVTVRLAEGGTVGYWLAPEARGRGVMTEALRAVVSWAREEHGIRRLVLTTHPDNVASQRVAERAGFVRVGLTEHAPPFRDGTAHAVLFELDG
jgi:RimJ/RimL family protein N-acetyltransferase